MSTVFFWFSNLDLTLAFSIETTSATRLGFQHDHHLRDIGGLQQLERHPPPQNIAPVSRFREVTWKEL